LMAKRVPTAGGGWILRRQADRLAKRGHARWLPDGTLEIIMDSAAPAPPPSTPRPVYDPAKHHAVAVDQHWIDIRPVIGRFGRGDGQLTRG
jgi:hypothetical protein